MLRISSEKSQGSNETNSQENTVHVANGPVASGGSDSTAPNVDMSQTKEPRSTQQEIEGNHAAHVLPWLTEEIRFHAALDMGCADGSAVKLLQEAGYDGHGIDLNPSAQGINNIQTGDFFKSSYEDGCFDVVICCNVLQDIPNYRISELLAEVNRISNSYIMITTPSTECDNPTGETREVSWWCERIRDFGWKFRILREDPETGHMVILAEKPNSLAAQILPLIDAGELDGSADQNPTSRVIAKIDEAVDTLNSGNHEAGFTMISELADILLSADMNLANVQPLFAEIIKAMEAQDIKNIISLLHNELRSALQNP